MVVPSVAISQEPSALRRAARREVEGERSLEPVLAEPRRNPVRAAAAGGSGIARLLP